MEHVAGITELREWADKALLAACALSHGNAASIVVGEWGADVHVQGDLPLLIAASNNDIRIVQLLDKAGADVWSRDSRALEIAASRGFAGVVQIMLVNTSSRERQLELTNRALRCASEHGQHDVVKLLFLSFGADPDRLHAKYIPDGSVAILILKAQNSMHWKTALVHNYIAIQTVQFVTCSLRKAYD